MTAPPVTPNPPPVNLEAMWKQVAAIQAKFNEEMEARKKQ
jgi:hypothetical protein